MDPVGLSMSGFSTPQVVLMMVAVLYAVLSLGWLVALTLLPGERPAMAWWAAYAGGSALALALIVVGMRDGNEPVRAWGNVLVLAATLALQRGLWAFMARPAWTGVQVTVLLVTAVVSWLGMDPAWAPLRIGVGSALWAGLYLWAGVDVFGYVQRSLRLRTGLLYALPMLLTAVMLSARAIRAAQSPATVLREVNESTLLNLGSSVSGLVAALVLHLMLGGLVVAKLLTRLERSSRHDALTGLLNRRAVDELLNQEAQRARRLQGVMAVLMVDVDNFKRLNDSLGHAAGDRALQHLSVVMASQMREIDHLARWGGEEFVALLPGTSGADALVLAERLCERVRSLPLVLDGNPLALTTSVGVAQWHGGDDSVAALLARADTALYAAKRDGRDCARPAADMVLRSAA